MLYSSRLSSSLILLIHASGRLEWNLFLGLHLNLKNLSRSAINKYHVSEVFRRWPTAIEILLLYSVSQLISHTVCLLFQFILTRNTSSFLPTEYIVVFYMVLRISANMPVNWILNKIYTNFSVFFFRANAELLFKFHVELHSSQAALQILTLNVLPKVALPCKHQYSLKCNHLKVNVEVQISDWLL